MLSALTAALDTVATASAATTLIDASIVHSALRDAVGTDAYDTLAATQPAVLNTLVGSLSADPVAVTVDRLRAQSGTYLSYPKLEVAVPNATPPGDYAGTLVVTLVGL